VLEDEAGGRIMSSGNGTRDLPTCSTVPQPTAPKRASFSFQIYPNILAVYFYVFFFYFCMTVGSSEKCVVPGEA